MVRYESASSADRSVNLALFLCCQWLNKLLHQRSEWILLSELGDPL